MPVERELNQYEWMLMHGDELADTMKEENGMNGPRVDALLTKLDKLDGPGQTRTQARKLLKSKLEWRKVGHLFNLNGELE